MLAYDWVQAVRALVVRDVVSSTGPCAIATSPACFCALHGRTTMADLDTGLILSGAGALGCILLLLGVRAGTRMLRSSAKKAEAWVRPLSS